MEQESNCTMISSHGKLCYSSIKDCEEKLNLRELIYGSSICVVDWIEDRGKSGETAFLK